MASIAPKLLMDVLRQERKRQNISRGKLSRATVRVGYDGVPESTIESYEVIPGRVPDAETLEALADALDIPPERFYEYPIAAARRTAKTEPALPLERQAPPGALGQTAEGSQPTAPRRQRKQTRREEGGSAAAE